MASLIPETTTRLTCWAFVEDAELSAIGRDQIIRASAKELAETALRKILHDCIKTEEYQGHTGQTLRLDVYVLSPDEMYQMIRKARQEGERDAMKWGADENRE